MKLCINCCDSSTEIPPYSSGVFLLELPATLEFLIDTNTCSCRVWGACQGSQAEGRGAKPREHPLEAPGGI